MSLNPAELAERLVAEAHGLGFDLVGIGPAEPPGTAGYYCAWLDQGYHGEMAYLARPDALAKRHDLHRILPGVSSVVVVGANYHYQPLPQRLCDDPARGIMASYAWGEDYHDVLLPRLHQLAGCLEAGMGQQVPYRAYVDTGPVLERDLAARSGLGFIGKNTCLIQPRMGSWLFLAELLLATELPSLTSVRARFPTAIERRAHEELAQRAEAQHLVQHPEGCSLIQGTCGRCTRCLDACPTGALVAPYVLDARRCISDLTIEAKGPMPRGLRPLIGNRVFGCDICQDVCPWNRRFAKPTEEPALQPGPDRFAPLLLDLMALDDEGFGRRFRHSPLVRAKRRGLLRNAAVALGNWGDVSAIPALIRALDDREPLIRGHAAWALCRIGTHEARQAMADALEAEADAWVREELGQLS
jgi:epoxyqueuosine reductase